MKNAIRISKYILMILIIFGAYVFTRNYAAEYTKTGIDVLDAGIVFVYGYIFLKLTGAFLKKMLRKMERPKRKMITKIWSYFIWLLIILIVIGIFTKSTQTLGLSIGLFSAGIAFAMQQPILCIAGWLVLMTKRPYKIGDRIVVDTIRGDVLDITIMYTVLRELGEFGEDTSGRITTIPNSWVLTSAILNYSGYNLKWIWDEQSLSLSYNSNYELAEKLLVGAVNKILKKECVGIKMHDLEMLGTKDLHPISRIFLMRDYIEVDIRYLTKSMDRRRIKSEVSKEILKTIQKHPNIIKLSYPHNEIILRKENINLKIDG